MGYEQKWSETAYLLYICATILGLSLWSSSPIHAIVWVSPQETLNFKHISIDYYNPFNIFKIECFRIFGGYYALRAPAKRYFKCLLCLLVIYFVTSVKFLDINSTRVNTNTILRTYFNFHISFTHSRTKCPITCAIPTNYVTLELWKLDHSTVPPLNIPPSIVHIYGSTSGIDGISTMEHGISIP